ncbi:MULTISPECIES: HTH domain-containing protein [Bacillus]|uniref:HTH domain-containing protein n=1 Tax=Bacillus TaxID=1386 RepID=UPI0002F161CA|nr:MULTISPECIES: HTH domain-containing protein [Bacillus]
MNIKMAVIGSTEFMEQLYVVANQMSSIEIIPYVYKEPKEAAQLVQQLKPCDVVYFSGALPYYFAKAEREQLQIPTFYLEQDEMTIATSLLSILYHKKASLQRVSIDLFNSNIMEKVLTMLGVDPTSMYMIDYKNRLDQADFDIDRIIHFHQLLWEQKKIDFVLTSIHAIFNQLQQLHIPVMKMTDPPKNIMNSLQAAMNQANYLKSKAAQVAVAYISTHESIDLQGSYLDEMLRGLNGSIQQLDEHSYILYSSRGETELLLEQNDFSHIVSQYKKGISIGFGYGLTIKDANQNALIALRFAERDSETSCIYVLTEEKNLLGPYPNEQKHNRLVIDDPSLLEIAKKTKLSPSNLSKVMQFSKSRSSTTFTAGDLSDYLQVTKRTAERTIKKLLDHGYVKIVGEEMTYHQGRPRAIYELSIPQIYQ